MTVTELSHKPVYVTDTNVAAPLWRSSGTPRRCAKLHPGSPPLNEKFMFFGLASLQSHRRWVRRLRSHRSGGRGPRLHYRDRAERFRPVVCVLSPSIVGLVRHPSSLPGSGLANRPRRCDSASGWSDDRDEDVGRDVASRFCDAERVYRRSRGGTRPVRGGRAGRAQTAGPSLGDWRAPALARRQVWTASEILAMSSNGDDVEPGSQRPEYIDPNR